MSVSRTDLDVHETITVAPDGRPMHEQPAWRRDFPIDWARDHYVERRELMKFLVLTSLAFRPANSGLARASGWRRRRPRTRAGLRRSPTSRSAGRSSSTTRRRTIRACSSGWPRTGSSPTISAAPTCPAR